MKSMISRPSEYLPDGAWKNVDPYGEFSASAKKGNAAITFPVSLSESPNTKIAEGEW